MKKGFKLLICFVFFLFIGLNVVSADAPSSISIIPHNNNVDAYEIRSGFPFYDKRVVIGTGASAEERYAFCLDSHKNIDWYTNLPISTNDTNRVLYENQSVLEQKVADIYERAYELGFGQGLSAYTVKIGDSQYNITERDFYAIVQMAVWDVVHPYDTGVDGNGMVMEYTQWLMSNGDNGVGQEGYNYQVIWGALVTAANNGTIANNTDYTTPNTDHYSLTLQGTDGMTESSDGMYLVSNEYTVSAGLGYLESFSGFDVFISSDNPNLNIGIQKWNGSSWSNWTSADQIKLKNGNKFKIRVVKPTNTATGDVSVNVTVGKESFTGGWTAYFYDGQGSSSQNIAVALPTDRSVSTSVDIHGSYTNTIHLDIKKADINSREEIAGAHMFLYNKSRSNSLVDSWTSETNAHTVNGIIAGDVYELREEYAPNGYIRLTETLEFTVDFQGTVSLVGESATINTSVDISKKYELTVFNELSRSLHISKVSATTGKEVPGAKLKICTEAAYNLALQQTGDGNKCVPDKEDWAWESKAEDYIIDRLHAGVYYIIEKMPPSGYVQQTNAISFEIRADNSVTKVKFENHPTKLVISKKDFTTEDELPGAHLKICTLEAYQESGKDCEAFNDLSWVSEDKPYEIEAIPYGKYVLIETIPPSNYVEGMIVDKKELSAYEFEISAENHDIKIDVYNKILVDVPKTGISLINLFAIGGLMIFIGYETIKIYRKKANS